MGERWAKKGKFYRKMVNIICKKTAKGMKPRNRMVEMEMQGDEVSLLFRLSNRRCLLLIDLFDDKNRD